MLHAIGLTKKFGEMTALHPLDLRVQAGEVYCLLGANGAGKTTTINLFLGFISPSAGQAYVNGVAVAEQPEATKRALAYIPESVALYPHMSGMENLAYFAGLAGHHNSGVELAQALSEAGLDTSAHARKVSGYSKGMRQKVVIALALVRRARAMLLDEPTSGLDPKAANEFGQMLKRLSASGVAVLMATHDLFRAKEVAHRIGIMKEGTLGVQLATNEVSHADLESIYLTHMHG